MSEKHIKQSKFLSLVLRHQPETIGIELDENGWVTIDELEISRTKQTRSVLGLMKPNTLAGIHGVITLQKVEGA